MTLRVKFVLISGAICSVVCLSVGYWIFQEAMDREIRELETRLSNEIALIQATAETMTVVSASAKDIGTIIEGRIIVYDFLGNLITDSIGPTMGEPPRISAGILSDTPKITIEYEEPFEDDSVAVQSILRMVDGSAGFVRLSAPISTIDAALSKLRLNILISGFLILTTTIVVTFLLAEVSSKRLRKIIDGLNRIDTKNFRQNLLMEAPGELRQLIAAINKMASRLINVIENESSERLQYSSILSTISDGVLVVDQTGVVDIANPAAIEMLGGSARFQPGDRLISLNHNYELNRLAVETNSSVISRRIELELLSPKRYIGALALPLGNDAVDVNNSRCLILLTDMTESKRIETTRREFVSNASHELRTPIAAISASIETLQAGALNDPLVATDFLRRMQEDTSRMDNMVSELLEISRLESGQERLIMSPTDPIAVLARATDHFLAQAHRGGVLLSMHSASDVPLITADRKKLDQVLSNLLSNAIHATPSGGTVKACVGLATGGVEFRVTDSGRGIPPPHLPHIFERFYKASPSRSDQGSGLGLAIARHVVQIHGGEIFVESTPGKGTTFIVLIPVDPSGEQITNNYIPTDQSPEE